MALPVAWASGVVGWSVVALLSIINNAITASWLHAVGSAFVGLVGVVITLVALFTSLDLAVSANGTCGSGPSDLSSVQGLNWTSIGSSNGSLEGVQLLRRDGLGFGQNVPSDLLGARRSGERTRIFGDWGRQVSEERGKGEGLGGSTAAALASVVGTGG